VITRALGVDDVVDADAWLIPVGGRQSYLVCSDGLTKELADEEIATILRDWRVASDGEPSGDPAERLVAAALAAGGRDNVTVVVLDSVAAGTVPGEGTGRIVAILPESLEDTLPRNRSL
jgi:serine/threonine protein phosphatase PrpC